MTKLHRIREIVENCLDRSSKYIETKKIEQKEIETDRDRYIWCRGLIDAYKFILEEIRAAEQTDRLVDDEAQ
jgi:hypothetical protein